jgi:hypothetical protein
MPGSSPFGLSRLCPSWCATAGVLLVAFVSGAQAQPPGFRQLAPGALTVIPPNRSAADTLLRDDLAEITARADLEWTPRQAPAGSTLAARGHNREFTRDIWCLEFAFKPPRTIEIDVPVSDEKMQRTRVWYVVYRVRNVGGLRAVVDARNPLTRGTEPFETPIRFVPQFVLESREAVAPDDGAAAYRAYLDRVVPAALAAIRDREDPARPLLDSAAMSAEDLQPGEERWGVAVWEGVDPRIDFFSIYVRGLTNALRWRQRPNAGAADAVPEGGREQTLQALRLDFWKPGDEQQDGDQQMTIGFAGMFERMALGGRLLADIGRMQSADQAEADAGLARLGLSWSGLLEPEGEDAAPSLLPLAKVIAALEKIPEPSDRGAVVRQVFGGQGGAVLEDLAREAAGPVDGERERARRQALAGMELTPEAFGAAPLTALATVLRQLESLPSASARAAVATDVFGPAGDRVEWLRRQLAAVRSVLALETVGIEPRLLTAGDARAAFAAVQPAVAAETDGQKRMAVLRGLFGPGGAALYADAAGVHEGIDHAWIFRYEDMFSGK